MNLCSPYRPRPCHGAPRSKPQAIVLLRHSDGTPWGSKPKDFKSYDGKGASKALTLALRRGAGLLQWVRHHELKAMLELQGKREQAAARESEAAE